MNRRRTDIAAPLARLYDRIDCCRFCRRDRNRLLHIHGAGARRPDLMLVLVNPTHRNLSSDPAGEHAAGPRFPFIGVRQFWRVLADGGLIDQKVAAALPPRAGWRPEHTELVRRELVRNRLYLSNIVKCCYPHGDYPAPEVVRDQLGLLAEEVRLVRPRRIVAFGCLVHRTLTGENVTLSEYWRPGAGRKPAREKLTGLGLPVVPCYFPIGRGNPKKAAAVLRRIARLSR